MGESIVIKYVKSQISGEWVAITPSDMDYKRYGKTIEEITKERDACNKVIYNTERYKT